MTSGEKVDEVVVLLNTLKGNENISSTRIDELTDHTSNMQLEMENLGLEKSETEKKLVDSEMLAKDLMNQIHQMEDELHSLHAQCEVSVRQLEEKDLEISEYLSKIEDLAEKHAVDQQNWMEHKNKLQEQVRSRFMMFDTMQKEKERAEISFNEMINNKQKEIDNLQTQKDELVDKVNATEQKLWSQIKNMKLEIANNLGHHQKVLEDKKGLNMQLKDLEESVTSMNHEMIQLRNEKEELKVNALEMEKTLTKRNEELLSLRGKYEKEGHEASARIVALSEQVKDLEEEVGFLQDKKKQLELQILNEEYEAFARIEALSNGNNALKQEVHSLQAKKTQLESQIENDAIKASAQITALSEQNNALQLRINSLQTTETELELQIENDRNELSAQIETLTKEKNALKEDVDTLQSTKVELELQIENDRNELSAQIETLSEQNNTLKEEVDTLQSKKDELTIKIEEQQIKLKEQEEAFTELTEEYKKLQTLFQECKEKLEFTEKKLIETTEDHHNNVESKHQIITDLERTIEDLKRSLEIKSEEYGTSIEKVRNIEVALVLSNRKLKVTEQLLAEKEVIHKTELQKLKQENKMFVERIATLSKTIASNNKAHAQIITEITEKVNRTTIGLDSMAKTLEENYENYEKILSQAVKDVQNTKKWVFAMNREKGELKKEVSFLGEEKEKLERKVMENEEMMKEKDDGMLDLKEEKKEAIRQLCLWVDYIKTRHEDCLKEILLKVPNGRIRREN